MQKYKQPNFDKERLGVNPFINNLLITVNQVAYENIYKEAGGLLLPMTFEMEASKFTKVFISSEKRILVSKLIPSAKVVLLWIIFEIDAGEDYLWINRERCLSENDISLNTYKKAIDDLVKNGLITFTTVKEIYWINPNFFFHGDRIRKYKNNVKIIKRND